MLNLRKIRKKRLLTMKELGALVGVTESAIGMYETGRRVPNYEMLLKLCEVLQCSVEDLITEREDGSEGIEEADPFDLDRLDRELLRRLRSLTPSQQKKVDAFVQGLLASREG